jgi:4-amino-4-deoxy-L-arabinose transferase-like glycosyltransferase
LLFWGALFVYLVTRLIGLTQFPIYFFTDEAIQTQSIVNLIKTGYQVNKVFLPTYFRNGEYSNLGLSVYLQWLPYLIFGKSAVITRAVSVLVTLIAAFSVGVMLRDVFKLKYWWAGTLFLSITPAWFLHSRTAFETVEFVSFYAGALCAYLLYRYRSAGYLYWSFFLAACAFYSYSPAQLIVPLTALALLISDFRYHAENRYTFFRAVGLLFLLSIPYMRFIFYNPHVPLAHLNTLGSYWVVENSFSYKLINYFSEYVVGISAWYWYEPNIRDLSRHLMKDYGHIMLVTLPFAVVGLIFVLRNLKESAHRVILVAMLAAPTASALVGIGITRTLLFVIPVSILTAIGLEKIIDWLQSPYEQLVEISKNGLGINWKRGILGLLTLLLGIFLITFVKQNIDGIVLLAIAIILSVKFFGVDKLLAQKLLQTKQVKAMKDWNLNQTLIAFLVFVILSTSNIWMLRDALQHASTWYTNYGLGGMQYGGFQIFDEMETYLQQHPETTILFSPDWANGADILAQFFLNEDLPIYIGSVRGHINNQLPLDDNLLFVITPEEYRIINESKKFSDITTEKIMPYPDGQPGFYFVRLRYADNADEVFEAERAARRVLQESNIIIDDQPVKIRYSFLDTDTPDEAIALLFDDDPFTFTKTLEANPFVLELTYPETKTINEFSIIVGSSNATITLTGYAEEGAEPITYTFKGRGTINSPELTFKLPQTLTAKILQIELFDIYSSEPAQIHIWEITFR